jgi:hypothetical protein
VVTVPPRIVVVEDLIQGDLVAVALRGVGLKERQAHLVGERCAGELQLIHDEKRRFLVVVADVIIPLT